MGSICKKQIVAVCLAVMSIGCAIASPTEPTTTIYVVHNQTNKLTAYSVDPSTGQLAKLDIGNVDTGVNPGDITPVFDKYLYVANFSEPTISMYSIIYHDAANSQKVVPLNPRDAFTQPLPWQTKFDPSSKYCYSGDYQSNVVSQFKRNEDTGELTPLSPPTVKAGVGTAGIGFNPLITPYAYVANMQENNIALYNFDSSTGQLTDTGERFKTGNSPRGIWFDHASHGYVLNFTDGSISMYYLNPTNQGKLEPIGTGKIGTGLSPVAITMDSTEHYAYIASLAANKIYMYKIETSGQLVPLNPPTIATGSGPRSMTKDTNNHLYVTDMNASTISMYRIDPATGLLAPLNPATIKTDFAPYIITSITR